MSMNADDKSIEELLRMAEHVANTQSSKDMPGHTGHRVRSQEAKDLVESGDYVNIWAIWHRIVALKDKGLAYAIGEVWVPKDLLDPDSDPEALQDEDGQYKCMLSSRFWFDEDKLMPEDTQIIYKAIDVVISMARSVGPILMQIVEQMMGENDDSDSD